MYWIFFVVHWVWMILKIVILVTLEMLKSWPVKICVVCQWRSYLFTVWGVKRLNLKYWYFFQSNQMIAGFREFLTLAPLTVYLNPKVDSPCLLNTTVAAAVVHLQLYHEDLVHQPLGLKNSLATFPSHWLCCTEVWFAVLPPGILFL